MFKIGQIIMFLIGLHYKQNKVIVSVKRYFFKKYYLKPLADDPRHRSKISNMFWTSCRFIAGYLVKASFDCKVTREKFDALVAENFPELMPYILSLRSRSFNQVISLSVDSLIEIKISSRTNLSSLRIHNHLKFDKNLLP